MNGPHTANIVIAVLKHAGSERLYPLRNSWGPHRAFVYVDSINFYRSRLKLTQKILKQSVLKRSLSVWATQPPEATGWETEGETGKYCPGADGKIDLTWGIRERISGTLCVHGPPLEKPRSILPPLTETPALSRCPRICSVHASVPSTRLFQLPSGAALTLFCWLEKSSPAPIPMMFFFNMFYFFLYIFPSRWILESVSNSIF